MHILDGQMLVAQVPVETVLLAFFIWGVLMAAAGGAITWVLLGEAAERDRSWRRFRTGKATVDTDDTTVIIPIRRGNGRVDYDQPTQLIPAIARNQRSTMRLPHRAHRVRA